MTQARLMIVEDDLSAAEDMRKRLENLGYIVSAIESSGEEAVRKVEVSAPDLILMAILLKGEMNGIEAAEQIKTRFDIPVVYMTAQKDDALIARADITEPFGYILKPFGDRELQIVVEIGFYKAGMEKRLKDDEERYRTVFDHATEGIMVIQDKKVCFLNRMMLEIMGSPLEDLKKRIGRSYLDSVHPEDRKKMAEYHY